VPAVDPVPTPRLNPGPLITDNLSRENPMKSITLGETQAPNVILDLMRIADMSDDAIRGAWSAPPGTPASTSSTTPPCTATNCTAAKDVSPTRRV
jgi:hypothetical protein